MDTYVDTKNEMFTKIPNIALYGYGDMGASILEKVNYDTRVISTLDYLYQTIGFLDGISRFSLEDMVVSCGYKPDAHKGKTNDIFKSILVALVDYDYISSDCDFGKIKAKELIKCKLNFDYSSNFSMVYGNVRDRIYSVENVNKAQLFAYYCYINARMHRRAKSEGDASINGGEYEYTYFGYDRVYDDLRITDMAITKYNEILSELNLIRYKNFGAYYYKNNQKVTRLTPNFYTIFNDNEDECTKNLEEGFNLFTIKDENSNKIFTHKPLITDNRSIGGKKSSLKKKEIKGTITPDEVKQMQDIEDILDDTYGIKSHIRKLFKTMESNNDTMPLSEYYDFEDETKGAIYREIEEKLYLIDDGSLTVDFEFYKEIMLEYDEKKLASLQSKVMTELKKNCDWGDENPMLAVTDVAINDVELTATQRRAKEVGLYGGMSADELFD